MNKRRDFLNHASLLFAGAWVDIAPVKSIETDKQENRRNRLRVHEDVMSAILALPNFCTHEHWGAINSFGLAPAEDGFRCDTVAGARPVRPTQIWDLLLDPYEGGWMHAVGCDPHAIARTKGFPTIGEWWINSPREAFSHFQSISKAFLLTGTFQTIRLGLQQLYKVDVADFNFDQWVKTDQLIAARYAKPFGWYKQAMQTCHFTEVIRPVHPEFYVNAESDATKEEEKKLVRNIMRIDPLLHLHGSKNARRKTLSGIIGLEPADAVSWRKFIGKIFDLAQSNQTCGIKQLQAYTRSLNFQKRSDREVKFEGELTNDEILVFQDWVIHECCRQAHERNWIHQVHIGTNNLANSSPLPLDAIAKDYPKMNMVLIHCWPFFKEAGFLAKFFPNVYVDSCWLPVLNPVFLDEALNVWLNYVPQNKIMLAHDSTHIEMAAGSAHFTRRSLANILIRQQRNYNLKDVEIINVAADLLQNNAVKLYGFGQLYEYN